MSKLVIGVAGVLIVVGSVSGCSGGDGGSDDDPAPVGGINGPARVDPVDGGATNNGGDNEGDD